MALRLTINNIWLRRMSKQAAAGSRANASFEGTSGAKIGEGHELYNAQVLKRNYGILPLLGIVAVGLSVLTVFVFRNSLTRDDVRYRSKGEFDFETDKNMERTRKFLTFNQKYKTPEGLKDLYKDLKEK